MRGETPIWDPPVFFTGFWPGGLPCVRRYSFAMAVGGYRVQDPDFTRFQKTRIFFNFQNYLGNSEIEFCYVNGLILLCKWLDFAM